MSLRKVVGPRQSIPGVNRVAMGPKTADRLKSVDSPNVKLPRPSLTDHNEYYLADFSIGTPPQPVSLLVDTGAWQTWVNPDCTRLERAVDIAECATFPSYNMSLSNPTPTAVPAIDQIVYYGDSSIGASLQGFSDVFTWGETKVPSQPFGVANDTVGMTTGILGLAPDGFVGFSDGMSNYSVVTTMAAQGVIASRVFSLNYGRGAVPSAGARQHAGNLVFGGVDRNQFKGELTKTPILPKDATVDGWRYWVSVTGVKHNAPGQKGNWTRASSPALGKGSYMVDSGTTGVYVTRDAFDAILAGANITSNQRRGDGFPIVNCSMADQPGSVSISFAATAPNKTEAVVDIPYQSLVHPQRNIITNETGCYFAVASAGNDYDDSEYIPILGLGFFKAAYTVFDWDNLEISVGQGASCGDGAADLVAVGKGPNAVPNVTGNCK